MDTRAGGGGRVLGMSRCRVAGSPFRTNRNLDLFPQRLGIQLSAGGPLRKLPCLRRLLLPQAHPFSFNWDPTESASRPHLSFGLVVFPSAGSCWFCQINLLLCSWGANLRLGVSLRTVTRISVLMQSRAFVMQLIL